MPPPPLRFDLLPRRRRPWLKAALAVVCLSMAAAIAGMLLPRQTELERLRRETQQARSASERPAAVQVSTASAPWQAAADQDGRLFALTAEPRLLEIERCADDKVLVTRLVHDESVPLSTLELSVGASEQVSSLVACLNTGGDAMHHWRLTGVEAQPTPVGGSVTPAQRVVLRRD